MNITEWGYFWTGGYLIEMMDGKVYHMHGWQENDAPWMNEAWVYTDLFDPGDIEVQSLPWEDYLVEVER